MARVTLALTKDQIDNLVNQLRARERGLLAELADVRSNLTALGAAINPWKEMTIASSNGDRDYTVRLNVTTSQYTCSCPSYQFASGLDIDQHCKHIRNAKARGLV